MAPTPFVGTFLLDQATRGKNSTECSSVAIFVVLPVAKYYKCHGEVLIQLDVHDFTSPEGGGGVVVSAEFIELSSGHPDLTDRLAHLDPACC